MVTTKSTKKLLRRYTSLSALIQLLRSKEITLLSPSKWDDRNDAYFLSQYARQKNLKAVLAACFAHWYDVWMSEGFETVRTAWLARAAGLGGPIRARLPHETHEGIFAGIDTGGALLLNQQGRLRPITAGEVFF